MPRSAPDATLVSASDQRNIALVVDDDALIRENLAEILTDEGFLCWCAANADAALRVIRERAPDIILLDFRMPGMSVEQFLERLKERPASADVPVILVTAAMEEDVPKGLGVDGVLLKPFKLDHLLEMMHDALSERA